MANRVSGGLLTLSIVTMLTLGAASSRTDTSDRPLPSPRSFFSSEPCSAPGALSAGLLGVPGTRLRVSRCAAFAGHGPAARKRHDPAMPMPSRLAAHEAEGTARRQGVLHLDRLGRGAPPGLTRMPVTWCREAENGRIAADPVPRSWRSRRLVRYGEVGRLAGAARPPSATFGPCLLPEAGEPDGFTGARAAARACPYTPRRAVR